MDEHRLDIVLSNYTELLKRIDDHIRRIEKKYPDQIACRKGCDACCKFLTLFPVEALAIARAFINLPENTRHRILHRLENRADACPLLIDSACALYAARPVICRTHGYPICIEKKGETWVDFCPKNFSGMTAFPQETLFSLAHLNTMLTAINQHFLENIDTDSPFPDRIPVSDAIFLLNNSE